MLTIEQSYQYLRGNRCVKDYLNAVKQELCTEANERKQEGDIFPKNIDYLIILT